MLPAAFVAPLRGLHDRVPARPYAQKSLIYFAIPDHAAALPAPYTFPAMVVGSRPAVTVHTVGAWLDDRMKRSRY